MQRIVPNRYPLDCRVSKLRWLPSVNSYADSEEGPAVDKLFLAAGWCPEYKEHRIALHSLRSPATVFAPDALPFETAPPPEDPIPDLSKQKYHVRHDGEVTDLTVVPLTGQSISIAASERGALQLIHISLPEKASVDDMKVQVYPSVALHRGAATAVDVWVDSTLSVASTGEDGQLLVMNVEQIMGAGLAPVCLSTDSAQSLRAIRWASKFTLVTVGTAGELQLWDIRQAGPTHTLCHDSTQNLAGSMHCVDVLRSRPHLCATGGEDGQLALWDLRHQGKPLDLSRMESSQGGSAVWEVHFDVLDRFSESLGAEPQGGHPLNLLACCEGGKLAVVKMGAGGLEDGILEPHILLEENSAINSFDVDIATGQDVICGMESGCLGYVRQVYQL